MPVSDYDRDSFVGRDDLAEQIVRRICTAPPQKRSLLIEGPANRGKSWLLCRANEKLVDHQSLTALIPGCPRVATLLFDKKDETREAQSPFDPLWLVACLWWELRDLWGPLQLFQPNGLATGGARAAGRGHLHAVFRQLGADAQSLLLQVTKALASANGQYLLALLADGLDELSFLSEIERQFVEPLSRSPYVRIVASRRTQVPAARWMTFSVRPQGREEETTISVERLSVEDAEEQLNRYFMREGAALRFADLAALFQHYRWQNPGANRRFADDAIVNQRGGAPRLVTEENVRACLLQLSRSHRYDAPISDEDFAGLLAVVASFPAIGTSEVPAHDLNAVLAAAAGRASLGDKERNEWLGRLQDRGIVVRRKNGQCLVHEEFAALCQEWEAQRA